MAVMIPSVISPDVKSTAERRIFEWFKNAPDTDDWIILHSLGIVAHSHVVFGETDFLVLAPGLGLYALEVKGGRVKCEDGIWTFMDKYGNSNSRPRGPFDQAKEGAYSIIKCLSSRIDEAHKYLKNVFFSYGVMFPDISFSVSSIDEEQWQVFDELDNKNVRNYILRLFSGAKMRWESVYGPLDSHKLPTRNDILYLASLLRGDFDYTVSMSTQVRNINNSLIRLTKEQFRCLDQLEDNPRCLIYGSAGTGKTLLAIEETKKSVVCGERVALFCFNANLADWLNHHFATVMPSLCPVFIGTLHKYISSKLKNAGITIPYPCNSDQLAYYYQHTLPLAALSVLEQQPPEFDKIIIDEAQDLISENYLRIIDACLSRGLSRGHWSMFGDFSKQAIYSPGLTGEYLIEQLENYSWFIKFKLTINCRNTKQISKEIQTITGFEAPKGYLSQIDGIPVQYITWSTMDEQRIRLQELLIKLQEDHIPPEQITILSPKRKENSVVSELENLQIHNFHIPQGLFTSFCTIQAFKGLENSVIILTDIDTFSSEKLMYVGLSRAISCLFVLESDSAKKEYDDLLIRRLLT